METQTKLVTVASAPGGGAARAAHGRNDRHSKLHGQVDHAKRQAISGQLVVGRARVVVFQKAQLDFPRRRQELFSTLWLVVGSKVLCLSTVSFGCLAACHENVQGANAGGMEKWTSTRLRK